MKTFSAPIKKPDAPKPTDHEAEAKPVSTLESPPSISIGGGSYEMSPAGPQKYQYDFEDKSTHIWAKAAFKWDFDKEKEEDKNYVYKSSQIRLEIPPFAHLFSSRRRCIRCFSMDDSRESMNPVR